MTRFTTGTSGEFTFSTIDDRFYSDVLVQHTADEVHVIPVMADGSHGERDVIPNDEKAAIWIGNKYFTKLAYTRTSAGGVSTYHKVTLHCPTRMVFGSDDRMYRTEVIERRAVPAWHSQLWGSAASFMPAAA